MSAKAVIQGLQDSQLIQIFLDFVATFRLHYEKHKKEISYKCFEATWVLPIAKATGYGRTENEAYKNALKNLLELLMQDPVYVEHFSTVLKANKANGQNKDHSPPAKVQLKTEGHQPQDNKYRMNYESYAKGQVNRPKQEVHHSKINLNKSMSQKGEPELQEAKKKLKDLQIKLAFVVEQNKVLREKMLNIDEKQQKQQVQQKKNVQQTLYPGKKTVSSQKSQKSLLLGLGNNVGKISIPKLNLGVLPNYHKKSQKCLNQILLAAYNDKHGFQKVY